MLIKFGLIVLAVLLSLSNAFDYCDKSICNGNKHVACKHSGHFDSKCPNDIKLVKMNNELKEIFLHEHNIVRDLVASGKHHRGFNRASRMCVMVWDRSLEYLASLNVMNCKDDHDKCLFHPDFVSVGQNLYSGYTSDSITAEMVAKKAMDRWHREAENAHKHHLHNYQGTKGIGHFLQMVNDRSCKIGCSMSLWTNGKRNQFYVVCNYSYTNIKSWAIYETNDNGCQMGKDGVYKNLCNRQESHRIHDHHIKEHKKK